MSANETASQPKGTFRWPPIFHGAPAKRLFMIDGSYPGYRDLLDELWKLAVSEFPGVEVSGVEHFVRQNLPSLAHHYNRKALDDLERVSPWLTVFKPSSISPTWEEARKAFLEKGPIAIDTLATFTNLRRIENSLAVLVSEDVKTGKALVDLLDNMHDYLSLGQSNISESHWNKAVKLGLSKQRLEDLQVLKGEVVRVREDGLVMLP